MKFAKFSHQRNPLSSKVRLLFSVKRNQITPLGLSHSERQIRIIHLHNLRGALLRRLLAAAPISAVSDARQPSRIRASFPSSFLSLAASFAAAAMSAVSDAVSASRIFASLSRRSNHPYCTCRGPVPPAAPNASPLPLPEEVSDGVLLFSPAVALSSSGLPNGKTARRAGRAWFGAL